jgi:hypothetical protein
MARNATPRPDNGATTCGACGAAFPVHPQGHCGGTGYAIKPDGVRICYPCAATAERADMIREGRGVLYLSNAKGQPVNPSQHDPAAWHLGNWTGHLAFPLSECQPYQHPFSHSRRGGIAFRFRGPDGAEWHGRHDAEHQLVTVRRCKPAKGAPRAR